MTDELREKIEKTAGHTPGPWNLEGRCINARLKNGYPFDIADAWSPAGQFDAMANANAQLISLAPELLSSLRAAEEENKRLREKMATMSMLIDQLL